MEFYPLKVSFMLIFSFYCQFLLLFCSAEGSYSYSQEIFLWWDSKRVSEKQWITGENRQQQTRQLICACRIYNNFGWYDVLTFVSFSHFPVYPHGYEVCSALVWRHVCVHYLCHFRPAPSPYLNFLRINITNTFAQQLEFLHTPRNRTLPFAAQTSQRNPSHGCFVHNSVRV